MEYERLDLSGFTFLAEDGRWCLNIQIVCDSREAADHMADLIPAMLCYEMGYSESDWVH